MLLLLYFELKRFQRLLPDWLTACGLTAYFILIAEHSRPFLRQFKLNDPRIQHPFAEIERVSGLMCLLLAAVVPLVVIAFVCSYKHSSRDQAWHVLNVSVLGLFLCIAIDGVVTDVLKAWIGIPRPDFLARCGPALKTPLDQFVDVSVCTAPLGQRLLQDGMRSMPSGHSLISFAAFGYLCMWLFGQGKLALLPTTKPLYLYLGAFSPLMVAAYIALSRVQDYRHSFMDITVGSLLGCVVALLVHGKYFHSFWAERSGELLDSDAEPILPI